MADIERERTRAVNLWEAFARKFPPLLRSAELIASPAIDFDDIGGLARAKEEMLTYACALTDPEIYRRWGTVQPTGLLMIGPPESGKSLLGEALARRTETPLLVVRVPRLVLQVLHAPGNLPALIQGWTETLGDMPRVTVMFREVDFSQVSGLTDRRPDVPVGPITDFVVELLDQAVAVEQALVIGSTSHSDNISSIFLEPGRYERIVDVTPEMPGDVVASLRIHAARAEERAGRPLFADVDWHAAVRGRESTSIGEWVRLLHAILGRKARCEAADEDPGAVTTADVVAEVDRFQSTQSRLPSRSGAYL